MVYQPMAYQTQTNVALNEIGLRQKIFAFSMSNNTR